jgi:hypothetical protein
MMTNPNANQNYKPLLPKTTQSFKGGNAPGQWIIEPVALFNRIGTSLDFEAGVYNEVSSIPSPWSRSLQLLAALRNRNYPTRKWLIDQYRGLLAAIALAENLKLSLQALRINLQDYRQTDFGKCLWKLRPNDRDNVLSISPQDGPWSQLYLFELEEAVMGFTSPATLVVPAGYIKAEISNRIPWVKDGFFTDPISNGLTQNQKSILGAWLQNLQTQLLANPVNPTLAGEVAAELEIFFADLAVSATTVFEPSSNPTPFGEALAPAPLTALTPAKAIAQASNVTVYASKGINPRKQFYLIDSNQLPIVLGRDVREINVIGSSSLLNFDPNLHSRSDALFLAPADLFTPELFYGRTQGLLPGTWLDRKLNVDNLTILLPINPVLKDYFTSQDLEKQIQLTPVATAEGPGVRVTLELKLSGFNAQPASYQVYQDFPLKAENEIKQAFPTVTLWPNVILGAWQEYFLLVETSENLGGLAFGIDEPTPGATPVTRESGQERYQYWKCDRFPQILSAIDGEGRFLGLLPLTIPAIQASSAGTWTVGVDFGTSFTNIYIRKGNGQPERLNLQTNLLTITSGLEELQANTFREFFVPDVLLPEGSNPPLSSVLTTRGWQESVGVIPEIISQARTYVPRLDVFDFDKEHIKTNIKWQQAQYQRPFLGQLLRLIAAQAANEGVHTIDWAFSYPSAFSRGEKNAYVNSWSSILEDLKQVTGQNHKLSDHQPVRTESIAFAQFCADVLNKDLVHTTCIDIGGGTSDLSVWQENDLIHQASVPYAGRELFHRILQPNMAFIGDIFGLPPETANSVRQQLASKKNFNSALDTYLRGNADKILTGGYVTNGNNPRNRQFRTLIAFSLGGLYHYLGLVQRNLNQLGQLKRTADVTTVLIGGNGSRFLHWLTPSGRYTPTAEINLLLDGILTRASGLSSNPNVLTLSLQPKEEACGGLVVTPDGDRLQGLDQKQEDLPFLGEVCEINGQSFAADQRLKLSEDWESITDFRIPSFGELERYITHFNAIIADERIEEIEALRRFDNGGKFVLTDSLRSLLETAVTQASLRKRGKKEDFEPDPPFLIVLRCFVDILSSQWSKSAG